MRYIYQTLKGLPGLLVAAETVLLALILIDGKCLYFFNSLTASLNDLASQKCGNN
jgi:hypothetical protein